MEMEPLFFKSWVEKNKTRREAELRGDEDTLERIRLGDRVIYRNRMLLDPGFKANQAARQRAYYNSRKTDPEFLAKRAAQARSSYARRKESGYNLMSRRPRQTIEQHEAAYRAKIAAMTLSPMARKILDRLPPRTEAMVRIIANMHPAEPDGLD